MTTTKKSPAKITLRTVFEHVQALHGEMLTKFAAVDKRFVSLEGKMKSGFKAVHEKMDTGFKEVHQKIDASTRRLSTQISNIDQRLDDVEIKEFPKLKKALAAR